MDENKLLEFIKGFVGGDSYLRWKAENQRRQDEEEDQRREDVLDLGKVASGTLYDMGLEDVIGSDKTRTSVPIDTRGVEGVDQDVAPAPAAQGGGMKSGFPTVDRLLNTLGETMGMRPEDVASSLQIGEVGSQRLSRERDRELAEAKEDQLVKYDPEVTEAEGRHKAGVYEAGTPARLERKRGEEEIAFEYDVAIDKIRTENDMRSASHSEGLYRSRAKGTEEDSGFATVGDMNNAVEEVVRNAANSAEKYGDDPIESLLRIKKSQQPTNTPYKRALVNHIGEVVEIMKEERRKAAEEEEGSIEGQIEGKREALRDSGGESTRGAESEEEERRRIREAMGAS